MSTAPATPPTTRPCPVCEHAEPEGYNAKYLRCPSCEAIYYFEIPTPEELTRVYSGDTLKRWKRKMLAPFRKIHHRTKLDYDRARNGGIYRQIRHLAGAESGRFLDIGCNRGFLLEAAMQDGWEVYGIEYSPEQIQPFLNSYPETKGRVRAGEFGELAESLPDGHFQVVTAIDVVEHFLDPRPCMEEIFRLLEPGGKFVFQTPSSKLADSMADGPAWGELKAAEHMTLFDPANLQTLATQVGFGEMTVSPEPFDHPRCNFVGVLPKP